MHQVVVVEYIQYGERPAFEYACRRLFDVGGKNILISINFSQCGVNSEPICPEQPITRIRSIFVLLIC